MIQRNVKKTSCFTEIVLVSPAPPHPSSTGRAPLPRTSLLLVVAQPGEYNTPVRCNKQEGTFRPFLRRPHLVDAGAHGLGEVEVVEGRGVGPPLDHGLVHNAVQLVRGHACAAGRGEIATHNTNGIASLAPFKLVVQTFGGLAPTRSPAGLSAALYCRQAPMLVPTHLPSVQRSPPLRYCLRPCLCRTWPCCRRRHVQHLAPYAAGGADASRVLRAADGN